MAEASKGALEGIRVLELGGAATYAGFTLANLGADVIKVEPPDGDPYRWEPPFAGETPDPERSLAFIYFNTNKRGVVLDFSREEDREKARALARTVDVVLEAFQPGHLDALGLGYGDLSAVNPGLVMVSQTVFGQTGPNRDFKGNNAVAEAMGGIMFVGGDKDRAPCVSPFEQLTQVSGLHAAAFALMALRQRDATGRGQHVDVSIQDVGTQMFVGISQYAHDFTIRRRVGAGPFGGGTNIHKLKDGYLHLMPGMPYQWMNMADKWMHDPVLSQPEFSDIQFRQANADAIEPLIHEWVMQFGVEEFVNKGQLELRIPCGPVNTAGQFAESAHVKERKWLLQGSHPQLGDYAHPGVPYHMGESAMTFRRPAPGLGEHTEEVLGEVERAVPAGGSDTPHPHLPPQGGKGQEGEARPPSSSFEGLRTGSSPAAGEGTERSGRGQEGQAQPSPSPSPAAGEGTEREAPPRQVATPRPDPRTHTGIYDFEDSAGLATTKGRRPLEGIRVVDFTRVIAGPAGTQVLGWYGAEVIKIESNELRGALRTPGQPGFGDLNRSKKSLTVDIRTPEGKRTIKDLVSKSDAVIDNFAAGVLDKLGLGYGELKKAKPDIVMVSMPGGGMSGPLRDWVAWGQTMTANCGLMYLWGYPDSPVEARPKYPYADYLCAAQGTMAVLAGLAYRDRTGKGQFIELAQVETMAHTIGPAYMDYFINGKDPEARGYGTLRWAPYDNYPCMGFDQWCVIAVDTEAEWTAFKGVLGNPAWADVEHFGTKAGRIAHKRELDGNISGWTRGQTARQVLFMLQKAGVAAGMTQSAEDVYADRHLWERGHIVRATHGTGETFVHYGLTGIFSESPGDATEPAPAMGQHNDEICLGLLGMERGEYERLKESKVIW